MAKQPSNKKDPKKEAEARVARISARRRLRMNKGKGNRRQAQKAAARLIGGTGSPAPLVGA